MSRWHIVVVVALAAAFFIFDVALPTPAAARWWDYPHSGYCPVGTCNRFGSWRVLNVRNCRPSNWCRWSQ